MAKYDVSIQRKLRPAKTGKPLTEIWAEICDKAAGQKYQKLIWWEDENGIYHDETPALPKDIRGIIDNKWIESIRKW